ncbi:hypothetical protein [Basilea psittacipulmonis]|uniref:DUF1351 domain-containing protein n=1 Tax=Basilea psittacipulmonis DSM 24701 TaxID=1072685 RepID=A0A077DJ01_9BURK|nr:hypothetical protein [Basilea psittacipulmonis]AIL33113.1 hypothetical protein IX83_07190 [Basilea psittacipulmonis DSM 24701]
MFELEIRAESRLVTNNIDLFKKQAEEYLKSLPTSFNNDEDFLRAEEDIKDLKTLEARTKSAIEAVINGSADISAVIDTATKIAEEFRQARLTRERLVKSRKEDIRNELIATASANILAFIGVLNFDNSVIKAIERIYNKSAINGRLEQALKNKRTISGADKAVHTECTLIKEEITQDATKYSESLKTIPDDKLYLFPDIVNLLVSNEDITDILDTRLKDEAERQAKLKETQENKQTVSAPAPEPVPEPVAPVVVNQEPAPDKEQFLILINLNCTLEEAQAIAKSLKDKYMNVRLKKSQ